jgi:hypothetical protein
MVNQYDKIRFPDFRAVYQFVLEENGVLPAGLN